MIATATATVDYELVFGPTNGCAYVNIESYLDQSAGSISPTATTEEYINTCAQFCDQTAGCNSFGANYFPACEGDGASYYCIAVGPLYGGSGDMECGIGTSYDGCSIYQNGTVYK